MHRLLRIGIALVGPAPHPRRRDRHRGDRAAGGADLPAGRARRRGRHLAPARRAAPTGTAARDRHRSVRLHRGGGDLAGDPRAPRRDRLRGHLRGAVRLHRHAAVSVGGGPLPRRLAGARRHFSRHRHSRHLAGDRCGAHLLAAGRSAGGARRGERREAAAQPVDRGADTGGRVADAAARGRTSGSPDRRPPRTARGRAGRVPLVPLFVLAFIGFIVVRTAGRCAAAGTARCGRRSSTPATPPRTCSSPAA